MNVCVAVDVAVGGGCGVTDASGSPVRAECSLGGGGSRFTGSTPEDVGDAHGDESSQQRSDQVGPPGGPVVQDEGGTQVSGRVDSGATHPRAS
jgi:hypothetical protein